MIKDWDKNSEKLCVDCKYYKCTIDTHECHHPSNLDKVDGSVIHNCYSMRHGIDLFDLRCTLGRLFEEKPKEIIKPKIPWYRRLFLK